MALMKTFLKCGQILNESLLLNSRYSTVYMLRTNTTAATEKTESEGEPKPPQSTSSEELTKLNKEIETLNEKNNEIMDKYKRALAEGENIRNRLTKQIQEAKQFGIQGFCKDLLDVADVLNKATESVPKEELNEKNPYLKSLFEGLIMTEQQLQMVFKRHGLEKLNPVDEKFNPNFHEALFQQEVQGKEAGTVVVVSKIGYKLHERVVRPALVGVSK